MSEPRIVESGPINIKVDMKQAVQLYLQNVLENLSEDDLKAFIEQWAAGEIRGQTEPPTQEG
jgi:hypothetical protein